MCSPIQRTKTKSNKCFTVCFSASLSQVLTVLLWGGRSWTINSYFVFKCLLKWIHLFCDDCASGCLHYVPALWKHWSCFTDYIRRLNCKSGWNSGA